MSTTIEPDEPTRERPSGPIPTSSADLESGSHPAQGLADIFRQSAHPVALFVLYLFRISAFATYILCGFFTDNYVVSTVIVVVLLAMDFWNCRNVAGRTLVGLRFWNQVDDDGESYWIFESRDPSRPANPIDSRLFWTALYVFPALWLGLFFCVPTQIQSIIHPHRRARTRFQCYKCDRIYVCRSRCQKAMGSEHRLLQLVSWGSRWADADWCCKEQRRQSLWIVACPLALFSFITMPARPASRIHCH